MTSVDANKGIGLGSRSSDATFGFFATGGDLGGFCAIADFVFVADENDPVTQAIGVSASHQAYLPDGSGGYVLGSRGEFRGVGGANPDCEQTWIDYASLAWAAGGAIWDLNQLRGGDPDLCQSFSSAFASMLTQNIAEQADDIGVQIVSIEDADGDGLDEVVDLSGTFNLSATLGTPIAVPQTPPQPNEVAYPFTVTLTGDGLPHQLLKLRFVDAHTGNVLGEIPVTLNVGYEHQLVAVDSDNDSPLTFAWTPGSNANGAKLVGDTIKWNPTVPGTYHFDVTVSDGRGGFGRKEWDVAVGVAPTTNSAPTILDDNLPDAIADRNWNCTMSGTPGKTHRAARTP